MVFLEYITTLHMDSVERWRGHKAETWYSDQKFMFTIMWNPSGFYVINILPNDIKMSNDYFVTNMLIILEQAIFPRGMAPHVTPTYLIYLIWASDFYSFPTVKEKLNGFKWLTRTSFWVLARDFEKYWSRRIEWRISGLGVAGSRSKPRQDNEDYVIC
jgi:hypothetical protein